MKKVSVIIPSYQHSKAIARCLESLFAQTYGNLEIIVVNDGSTDDTMEVLERYRGRVTLIEQENRGGNAARNRGFREASGDLLLFSDADLVWEPRAIDTLVHALEGSPEAAYAYSSFRYGWKKFRLWPFDAEKLREMPYIHTSALIRREAFPGFDESLKRLQDWDLFLTMLENGHEGVWVDKVLFIAEPRGRGLGISEWLPKAAYKIPWKLFGWKPETIRRYEAAADIVKRKHGL